MLLCRYFGSVDVKLPDLGEGTKEATVKEFFVKVGDEVEEVSKKLMEQKHEMTNYFLLQYQDLCEVFTDKLVAKIPSTATGKVTAIKYGDDDIIPVGHVIIQIEEAGGESTEVAAAEPASSMQAAEPLTPTMVQTENVVKDKVATAPPGNQNATTRTKALSTPAVRHIAKSKGIDINQVPGTGKNGRVTKSDILAFIDSGHGTASQSASQAPQQPAGGIVQRGPTIAPLTGVTEQDT